MYFTDHTDPAIADGGAPRPPRRSSPRTAGRSTTSPTRRPSDTFERSRLDWDEPSGEPHDAPARVVPRPDPAAPRAPDLRDPRLDRVRVEHDAAAPDGRRPPRRPRRRRQPRPAAAGARRAGRPGDRARVRRRRDGARRRADHAARRSGRGPRAGRMIYGGIEAGGTKWVCAVGAAPGDIARHRHVPDHARPTRRSRGRSPSSRAHGELAAVGVGCFGPLDLRPRRRPGATSRRRPKPGWSDTDVAGALAARARRADRDRHRRQRRGARRAPLGQRGRARHVLLHHRRHRASAAAGSSTASSCTASSTPSSATCACRTIASAIRSPASARTTATASRASRRAARSLARWGVAGEDASDDARVGARGGVPGARDRERHERPLARARRDRRRRHAAAVAAAARSASASATLLAGYFSAPELAGDLSGYIVAPALGARAGSLGALELARRVADVGEITGSRLSSGDG